MFLAFLLDFYDIAAVLAKAGRTLGREGETDIRSRFLEKLSLAYKYDAELQGRIVRRVFPCDEASLWRFCDRVLTGVDN